MAITTVLLIDDDPVFNEEMAFFLEGHGVTCHAVATPGSVLALLDDLNPDLVLLDQRWAR